MQPNIEPLKTFSVGESDLKKSLEDERTLFMIEGGVVRTGLFHGQPCVVTDEGTLADFMEKGEDIRDLIRVHLFESDEHRAAFVESQEFWRQMREKHRGYRLWKLDADVEAAYRDGGLEAEERDALLMVIAAFRARSGTNGA